MTSLTIDDSVLGLFRKIENLLYCGLYTGSEADDVALCRCAVAEIIAGTEKLLDEQASKEQTPVETPPAEDVKPKRRRKKSLDPTT
jgi:hypothetical protein